MPGLSEIGNTEQRGRNSTPDRSRERGLRADDGNVSREGAGEEHAVDPQPAMRRAREEQRDPIDPPADPHASAPDPNVIYIPPEHLPLLDAWGLFIHRLNVLTFESRFIPEASAEVMLQFWGWYGTVEDRTFELIAADDRSGLVEHLRLSWLKVEAVVGRWSVSTGVVFEVTEDMGGGE